MKTTIVCPECRGLGTVQLEGHKAQCRTCCGTGEIDKRPLKPVTLKQVREMIADRRQHGMRTITLPVETVADLIETREAVNHNRALKHIKENQRKG